MKKVRLETPIRRSSIREVRPALLPKILLGAVITLSAAASLVSTAATGLDPSFANGGISLTDAGSSSGPAEYNERATAVAVQADGKMVIAGYSGSNPLQFDFSIARFNIDGSFDMTFGVRGKLLIDFGNSREAATALVIQPDGKIVIGGITSTASSSDFAFARLKSDGSLDTTFSGDGKAVIDIASSNDQLSALTLQADGKILAAGSITATNKDFAVIRLLPDGSRDYSFRSGLAQFDFGSSLSTDEAFAIAVQADGAIVVAGQSSNNFALARLTSSGALDTTFSGDGKVTATVGTYTNHAKSVAIQSDGKIVVGGYSTYTSAIFALARFNSNGTLDTTFSGDGMVTDGTSGVAYSVMLGANGTITLAGGAFSAVRYTSEGVLDTSFASTGRTTFNFGYTANAYAAGAAMRPDGTIVMGGYSIKTSSTQVATCAACVTGSGIADLTFSLDGYQIFTYAGASETVWGVALQSDGKIVAAGNGASGNRYDVLVMRRNPDGTPDSQFGTNGIALTPAGGGVASAFCTAIQQDGGIIAAGRATNPTVTDFLLVRYLPNGSLDTSFGTGGTVMTDMSGSYDQIVAVKALADGRILACGTAKDSVALARYLPSGALDPSFGSGGKVTKLVEATSNYAYGMCVLPSGKILVAGYAYISSTSTYVGFVIRFLENGLIDSTFGSAGIARQTLAGTSVMWNGVNVQADGRIVLAGCTGSFLNYDFVLSRLQPNGGLDTTFGQSGWLTVPFGTNDGAETIAVASNDKIIAAGWANIGGFDRVAAVRLMPDGRMDSSFSPGGKIMINVGTGASSANSIVIQNDHKPVIVGPAKGAFDDDLSIIRLDKGNPAISLENPDGTRLAEFSTIPFGVATTGTSGVLRSLMVRNEGEENLSISPLVFGGTHATDFQVSPGNLPTVLSPGTTIAMDVRFVPSNTGNRSASLAIPCNDPANTSFQLYLSGVGNMPPAFTGYAVSTPFGKPVSISKAKLLAKASDLEGDALGVTPGTASANGGTILPSGTGQWVYTPPVGFSGTDSFPITITDARGGSYSASITATVGPSPDTGGVGANQPRISRSSDGKVAIVFNGIPGRQYPIQRSSDLLQWQTIATITADAIGIVRTIDDTPGSDSAFYRLALPP